MPASATLDGFPAYPYCGNFNVYTDNGIDTQSTAAAGWTQTEGGYGYQPAEWAVRYFYFKWGVSHNWFVSYPKDMCGTHPSDVSMTTSPIHGDLAVIIPGCAGADPTAGHVVAIDTIDTVNSSLMGVQQNPAGTHTWPSSCVACYLHAANNNPTAPVDAGTDSGTTMTDAGNDSGAIGVDAGTDAGTVGIDAGTDSGTGGVDAGPPDIDASTPVDAGHDSCRGSGRGHRLRRDRRRSGHRQRK
jgi:hypothetical protein